MDWRIKARRELIKTRPFAVEELEITRISTGRPLSHPYFRITAPSWVNVFALTEDKSAILIRQPRAGAMIQTVEVPGGNIDDSEDPQVAALRELEEETGYIAASIKAIGTICPNPAIMDNKLHMFLAEGCRLREDRRHFPDATEEIEVFTVDLPTLERMIERGEMHNALANLTVLMAQKYVLKTRSDRSI
jgi:8-oxo-dGTP pyrophosphatase MutT (NUDIX family)